MIEEIHACHSAGAQDRAVVRDTAAGVVEGKVGDLRRGPGSRRIQVIYKGPELRRVSGTLRGAGESHVHLAAEDLQSARSQVEVHLPGRRSRVERATGRPGPGIHQRRQIVDLNLGRKRGRYGGAGAERNGIELSVEKIYDVKSLFIFGQIYIAKPCFSHRIERRIVIQVIRDVVGIDSRDIASKKREFRFTKREAVVPVGSEMKISPVGSFEAVFLLLFLKPAWRFVNAAVKIFCARR